MSSSRRRPTEAEFSEADILGGRYPTWRAWAASLHYLKSPVEISAEFDFIVDRFGLSWGKAHTEKEFPSNPFADQEKADAVDLSRMAMSETGPTVAASVVARHILSVTLPVVWDASGSRAVGVGEFQVAVGEFVSKKRLSILVTTLERDALRVSFATEPSLIQDRVAILPLIVQTQLLAVHLAETAQAAATASRDNLQSRLTDTELEVLRRTLFGQTSPEIGHALGLSGSLVADYANSAAEKLGCSGKHHAAARALHRGWLLIPS